ncbi:hypothetical protein GCM10011344_32690 [Dokdonia pacifica]|uniref:Short C-terminal domain-containing protein n=1 Tax=Dokdonia pacifica TaxID=1627892 RepID=A0A239BHD7_9FLAO|nr:SHOCT domain-containing protein [Dokdonia pacifica]GGG29303.1 hypothetical protein GCM10011344_32690 [Dokdonia pacifica]SNS07577.1 Short C-terminal domain-containing protein [Dokdonia pacifica]
MKKLLILILCLCSLASYSQSDALIEYRKEKAEKKRQRELSGDTLKSGRVKVYKASNGITYKVGEFYELNEGSDTNGKFVHANIGGWGISTNAEANRLGASNRNLRFKLKKIRVYNGRNFRGVIFTIGGGNITNYTLNIEGAISTCEILPCTPKEPSVIVNQTDKYDQLAKIKKLYDEGVLTKEEYEAEKKKILNKN